MFQWAQKALADTLGTEEPTYGPDGIQPVTKQGVQYTELKKDDLKWKGLGGTNGKYRPVSIVIAPLTLNS